MLLRDEPRELLLDELDLDDCDVSDRDDCDVRVTDVFVRVEVLCDDGVRELVLDSVDKELPPLDDVFDWVEDDLELVDEDEDETYAPSISARMSAIWLRTSMLIGSVMVASSRILSRMAWPSGSVALVEKRM